MKTKTKSSLITAALCLSVFAFASCAFLENPNTSAAIGAVTNGALAYSSGNTVGAAVDGIQGAAYLLRSLQSTPAAASPSAVATAVTQGGAAPIADTVASAVAVLVHQGKTPDAANEAVAAALDAVTANAPSAAAKTSADRSYKSHRTYATHATYASHSPSAAHNQEPRTKNQELSLSLLRAPIASLADTALPLWLSNAEIPNPAAPRFRVGTPEFRSEPSPWIRTLWTAPGYQPRPSLVIIAGR